MKILTSFLAAALLSVCSAFGQTGTVIVDVPVGQAPPAFAITSDPNAVAQPAEHHEQQVTVTRYYVQPQVIQVAPVHYIVTEVTPTVTYVQQPTVTYVYEHPIVYPAPVLVRAPCYAPLLGLAVSFGFGAIYGNTWHHSSHYSGHYHYAHHH